MTSNPAQDVALIVGGGPGISSSCARLFAKEGMRVAVAARQPDKPVLQALENDGDNDNDRDRDEMERAKAKLKARIRAHVAQELANEEQP